MVSLVTQPKRPFVIFLCHQASKFVSKCRAHCPALSRRALLVGCSSLEDDSLDSLEDASSLGLGWCRFCHVGGVFSLWLDSMSISSWVPKMWLTPERVFLIGEHPGLSSPSEATWPSLKTSASPPLISAYSSSWGASSSAWEGSDLLLDSLSSLLVRD